MPLIARKIAEVCLFSSHVLPASALTAAISTAHAAGLLGRDQSTCAAASLSPCVGSLPANFCCPSSTTCIALNDASSVICCPAGQDCSYIAPITCDISQQDAALHPMNQIHTSNLTATLATCGRACCPLGYACQNGMCAMIARDKPATSMPLAVSQTSSSVPTASQTTLVLTTPISRPTPAASASAPSTTASNQPSYPAKAVLAGLFPGLFVGILITLFALFFLRRRRRQAAYLETPDLTSTNRTVSDPIYHPSFNGNRTDFLVRQKNVKHPDFATQTLPCTPSRRICRGASQRSMRSLLPASSIYPSYTTPSPPPTLPPTTFTPPQSATKKDTVTPVRRIPRMAQRPSSVMTPVRTAPPRKDPIGRSIRRTPPPSTPGSSKEASSETIDVLMPPSTAGLQPPPVLWMRERERERPDTGRTAETTFSGIMDQAGLGKYYTKHMPGRR